MSYETRGPSRYQNSLKSDHPLGSSEYLIFSNFNSLFSPPDGGIEKNDFIKSICAGPWHGYRFLSSYRVQKHQTCQITEPLPPNSPKESESSTVTSITYQGHLLILSTKLHPDSSTPSVFQDFPLQLLPISKDLVGIWSKSSETWIPSKYQISLRSDHLFVR